MIYKLNMIEDKDFTHPCYPGGFSYNGAPTGTPVKITENDFHGILGSHSPDFIGYAQITDKTFISTIAGLGRANSKYTGRPKTEIVSAKIFFWDDFCVVVEYHYWEGTVDYWKVAPCHHAFKEIGGEEARSLGITHFGMCYHVEKCTACGATRSYDSSG